jgi:Arc/MetJ-type ribon-helix-helix transcriptional regulator
MPTSKVAITLDEELLKKLDRQVREGKFPNRSRAIQDAVEEKLARLDRTRLIRESAKLDPEIEQKLADEGLAEDFEEWPEY